MKKGVVKIYAKFRGKQLRQSLFFKSLFSNSVYPSSSSNLENKESLQLIKKETLAQVFSWKFFTEYLRAAIAALNNLQGDKFLRIIAKYNFF